MYIQWFFFWGGGGAVDAFRVKTCYRFLISVLKILTFSFCYIIDIFKIWCKVSKIYLSFFLWWVSQWSNSFSWPLHFVLFVLIYLKTNPHIIYDNVYSKAYKVYNKVVLLYILYVHIVRTDVHSVCVYIVYVCT
jgi:hypothetical protein